MKQAFTYMFNNTNFKFYAVLLWVFTSLFVFCSNFLFCIKYYNDTVNINIFITILIVSLSSYILIEGYRIFVIKTQQENKKELPTINLKNDLIIGFKFLCSYTIYLIPLYCILGAFWFNVGYAYYYLTSYLYLKILFIIAITLLILGIVWINIILPASILVFTKTKSFWSFYKFEEVFKIIINNKKKYLIAVIIYFLAVIIINLLNTIICKLSVDYNFRYLALSLLSSILNVYLFFTVNYVIANIETNE